MHATSLLLVQKKKIINISKTLLGDILHQHAYAVSFTAWTFVQIVCGYTSLMKKKKRNLFNTAFYIQVEILSVLSSIVLKIT